MSRIRSLFVAACIVGLAPPSQASEAGLMGGSSLTIVPVQRSQTQLTVSIAGTVVPFRNVQLTAQMPGRVERIYGREGDTFSQGYILVELDDSALLAKREAALAAREAAIAAIQNAQAQYQREMQSPRSDITATAPGGFGFPAMVDEMFGAQVQDMMGMRDQDAQRYSDVIAVRTGLAQARTSYTQAEANIREIDSRLRDTLSVTPFDGVIDNVHVEEGDTVQPGQPLVDFSQGGLFKVEADLPVHLVRTLSPGMSLPVYLDNKKRRVLAQVYRIHPTADLKRHTVRVEFTLPRGTAATAGQYAELEVTDSGADIPNQMSIPRSAIIEKGGMPLVFSIDENGVARLRVVRLGDDIGDGRVAVLSGIREGDRIIDSPPPGLKAGQVVAPPPQSSAGTSSTQQNG